MGDWLESFLGPFWISSVCDSGSEVITIREEEVIEKPRDGKSKWSEG